MSDEVTNTSLSAQPNYQTQLQQFELGLLSFLGNHGLPTDAIFVSVDERGNVFRNIEGVLAKIDDNHRGRSIYLSKFVAAVASGLFDAALNYLWDETIFVLRNRVSQYDLSYFYDHAVSTSSEKRKRLQSEDDLDKIDDSELIHGAKEIELISELGYRHLDYIRYMRNWASAAHPNQNELTGLQLVSWLETCIREVLSLPLSNVAVGIKKLLNNIKTNTMSEADAKETAMFFVNLTQDQVDKLASGFFGIYTRLDTAPTTRQNIHRLLPFLWDRVDEKTREQFGVKYRRFAANNDSQEKELARDFLGVVSAVSYIPSDLRVGDFQIAIENLVDAHRGYDNFHSEPAFARELQRIVGDKSVIPPMITREYVLALVEVFLTNGRGVAWNAEDIYKELIERFTPEQGLFAVLSFTDTTIASRLQFNLCRQKFLELLDLMRVKVTAPAIRDLIDDIVAFRGPLDRLKDDSRIKQKVANLEKILD